MPTARQRSGRLASSGFSTARVADLDRMDDETRRWYRQFSGVYEVPFGRDEEIAMLTEVNIRFLTPVIVWSAVLFPARGDGAVERITFASLDGLKITADLYAPHKDKSTPFILLCHQAGWSRGEYREIAPRLNALGFNCLAIDQRSGKEVNGVTNETAHRANEKSKPTDFVSAEQDIIAALKYVKARHAKGKLILWGSSYSAALALRIAGEHPELIDGVLAFAPGEYFVRFGKPNNWITKSASKIRCPVFVTSARQEVPRWQSIFNAIASKKKTRFVPKTAGNHGSRALWKRFGDSSDYWNAVKPFLAQFTD